MKILFVLTPAFDPNSGGVQRTTYKLGKFFTENGLEVSYFSFSVKGHVAVEYGRLYFVKEAGRNNNSKNVGYLEEVLGKVRPDFVINQMPYEKAIRETLWKKRDALEYVVLSCLRNSLFNFISNVEDRMQQMLPAFLYRLMNNPLGRYWVRQRHIRSHSRDLRSILEQSDRYILLTPPNREELRFFVGDYLKEKVIAIPNSIPEVVDCSEEKEKIVLHVGRMNIQQKRADLLLDVWEKCMHRIPDWTFVVVGDGPYLDTLVADIRKRDLVNVKVEGFQKPELYYRRSPVFVMPSAYEGFPNTLIEAQSFGCVPFVFNSYPALQWILDDRKNGFLVEPYDTQAMVEELIALLNDDGRLKSMQSASLENARRFTISKVGEEWLTLFNSLKTNNEE